MMTHPDEVFAAAKEKMVRYQQEASLAHAQACQVRHWLAERVRRWADRLDAGYQSAELVVGKQ